MSFSSLQAQLAALPSSSSVAVDANPGVQHGMASLRHEDALGRGAEYSVLRQQGGGVRRHGISLLYSKRQVSDIPLAVCQQQAMEALEELLTMGSEDHHQLYHRLVTLHLLPLVERGASSTFVDDDQMDVDEDAGLTSKLQQALLVVTLLLFNPRQEQPHTVIKVVASDGQKDEEEAVEIPSVFLVVEYFVRRYDIHRPQADRLPLLWAFLPHMEKYRRLWGRALSLVDVTTSPANLWLRPYSSTRKGQENEIDVNLPPEALVAKQIVWMQMSWFRYLMSSTTNVMKWGASSSSSSSSSMFTKYLTWSAKLILQGLEQTRELGGQGFSTAKQEAMLRTLLPCLLVSCRLSKAWAYVVSSAVAECMPLAAPTVSVLARSIWNSASMLEEERADALTAILSILVSVSPHHAGTSSEDKFSSSYIPLLNGKWLGCLLPLDLCETLILSRDGEGEDNCDLAAILGLVYRDRRIVVAPLVAALFASSFHAGAWSGTSTRTILELEALVRQESLLSMWKDPRIDLNASLSAWIVDKLSSMRYSLASEQGQDDVFVDREVGLKSCRKILLALHDVDPFRCEAGLARAFENNHIEMTEVHANDGFGWGEMFHGLIPTGTTYSAGGLPDSPVLLPPSVAIEHEDDLVRLDAVSRIQMHDSEGSRVENSRYWTSTFESLLHRWSYDRNPIVAAAAGKKALDIIKSGNVTGETEWVMRRVETLLSGIYRWIDQYDRSKKDGRLSDLVSILEVGSVLASNLLLTEVDNDDWKMLKQFVLESQASLLWDEDMDEDPTVLAAATCVVALLSTKESHGSAQIGRLARNQLTGNSEFVSGLLQSRLETQETRSDLQERFRLRSMLLVLRQVVETSRHKRSKPRVSFSFDPMTLCLSVLYFDKLLLNEVEADILRSFLGGSCGEIESGVSARILSLASVPSIETYSQVVQPFLIEFASGVRNAAGKAVSEYTVLMDVACAHQTNFLVAQRILLVVTDAVKSGAGKDPELAVVPALSFLENSNATVRRVARELILALGARMTSDGTWLDVADICKNLNDTEATSALGGNFFSGFLASCLKSAGNRRDLSRSLLRLCVCSVASFGTSSDVDSAPFECSTAARDVEGGSLAAAAVLDALELAGEDLCPLILRWSTAGLRIFEGLIEASRSKVCLPLIKSIVRMLKGVTVSEPQIIVSSGPSTGGGRSRSYSVGRLDGVTFLKPYPEDMVKMISRILKSSEENQICFEVSKTLVEMILTSNTWNSGVFADLIERNRTQIASSVLQFVNETMHDIPDGLFQKLQLNAADVAHLLKNHGNDMASVSILCEFIMGNLAEITGSSHNSSIAVLLSRLVTCIASQPSDSEYEFVLQTLLLTLSAMFAEKGERPVKIDRKTLGLFLEALLVLSGEVNQLDAYVLKTYRSRSAVVSVLSSLRSSYPKEVIHATQKLMSVWASKAVRNESDGRDIRESLVEILRILFDCSDSVGISTLDIFAEFIRATSQGPFDAVHQLYMDFGAALLTCQPNRENAGSLFAEFLAAHVMMTPETDDKASSAFVVQVIADSPGSTHLPSLQLFFYLSKGLLLLSSGGKPQPGSLAPDGIGSLRFTSPSDFLALIISKNRKNRESIQGLSETHKTAGLRLSIDLMRCASEMILVDEVQRVIRNSDFANQTLRLWQDMLATEPILENLLRASKDDTVAEHVSASIKALNDCRECLQKILPLPLFLASVSSIISNCESDEVCDKALRLVADRLSENVGSSREIELFVELVPDISRLLEGQPADKTIQTSTMQCALLALEHIARAFGAPSTKSAKQGSRCFVDLLSRCSILFESCRVGGSFTAVNRDVRQLACSLVLSSATFIKVVGPRCIATAPKMLKSLVAALISANSHVTEMIIRGDSVDTPSVSEARLFQHSILRVIEALLDAVPQIFFTYIQKVLTSDCLLSPVLREAPLEFKSIVESCKKIDERLPSCIPPRVLIPACSDAGLGCTNYSGMLALISVATDSVNRAASSAASGQLDSVLRILRRVCEQNFRAEERQSLVESSETLLLAIVFKLSEVQLRGMISSLREWRRHVDESNPDAFANRRFAFWSWTAALSRELRNIFLPCMDLLLADTIVEIKLAGSHMSDQKRLSDEPQIKRPRLDDDTSTVTYGVDCMRCVRPVLSCLEHALRADARDGGKWIRADDNEKFESLVDPLCALLKSRIPQDFPIPQATLNAFEYIVEGAAVNCLTALALAAGDDSLWKSLNHSILEACGHESRAEVRKAGVLCLMSMMRCLGEEYMVLLPECLPVLSELLEDDEENAALARECIALAEELIGESLEEDLR